MGMNHKETLECQNMIVLFSSVMQEIWPNKRGNKGGQNLHVTQIPSYVEVMNRFAMNYHIALF